MIFRLGSELEPVALEETHHALGRLATAVAAAAELLVSKAIDAGVIDPERLAEP